MNNDYRTLKVAYEDNTGYLVRRRTSVENYEIFDNLSEATAVLAGGSILTNSKTSLPNFSNLSGSGDGTEENSFRQIDFPPTFFKVQPVKSDVYYHMLNSTLPVLNVDYMFVKTYKPLNSTVLRQIAQNALSPIDVSRTYVRNENASGQWDPWILTTITAVNRPNVIDKFILGASVSSRYSPSLVGLSATSNYTNNRGISTRVGYFMTPAMLNSGNAFSINRTPLTSDYSQGFFLTLKEALFISNNNPKILAFNFYPFESILNNRQSLQPRNFIGNVRLATLGNDYDMYLFHVGDRGNVVGLVHFFSSVPTSKTPTTNPNRIANSGHFLYTDKQSNFYYKSGARL